MRFLISLLVGLGIGAAAGLYLGWIQFPVEFVNSPMTALAERYQDDYTVMIAAGYVADGDLNGAVDRLRLLDVDNIPDYVQNTTERYITNSRDVQDIRYLVSLAARTGPPDADHGTLPSWSRCRGAVAHEPPRAPRPPATLPEEMPPPRSRYNRPRRLLSIWGLGIGLILGLTAGLTYAWTIDPVVEYSNEPWQLKAADRANYMVGITLAFAADRDLNRAIERLRSLQDQVQALIFFNRWPIPPATWPPAAMSTAAVVCAPFAV